MLTPCVGQSLKSRNHAQANWAPRNPNPPQPQDLPVGGVGFLHTAVRLGQLRPPECVSCQLCRRSHHKPGMHVFIYFEKLQDFFPPRC